MNFLKLWRRSWHGKASANRKELIVIYAWISLKTLPNKRCPYAYVFKIVPISNGDSIPIGFERGRELRRFVHAHVLWKDGLDYCMDTMGQNVVPLWDQIIPSTSRLPTHRLELGLMRKGSKIPRSPFFNEYFCFLPLDGGDSNGSAIRIGGFLASRLKEINNFDGDALISGKAYWLSAIMAAWKQLG